MCMSAVPAGWTERRLFFFFKRRSFSPLLVCRLAFFDWCRVVWFGFSIFPFITLCIGRVSQLSPSLSHHRAASRHLVLPCLLGVVFGSPEELQHTVKERRQLQCLLPSYSLLLLLPRFFLNRFEPEEKGAWKIITLFILFGIQVE